MVRELAEFLLTTLKTHINCKSYNRFGQIIKKDFEIFLVLDLIGYYSLP